MPGIKRKRTRSHGPRRVRARIRVHIRRRHRGRKSAKKAVNLPATTFQSDHRVDYVRRPAPKRVKRRVRAFIQKVQRVIAMDIPTQVYNFNFGHYYSSPQGGQEYLSIPLYAGLESLYEPSGLSHPNPVIANLGDPTNVTVHTLENNYHEETNPVEWNHLFKIFQNVFNPSQSGLAPQGLHAQYLNKILFTNAVLNLEISNVSLQGTNNSGTAYIDVYHLWARKDCPRTPEALFVEGITQNQPASTASGTVISDPNTPYLTAFDSPLLCRNWLIKSKRSFTLNSGQNVRLQLRDKNEYSIGYEDFIPYYLPSQDVTSSSTFWAETPYTLASLKKFTECYFIIWKGAPSNLSGSSSSQIVNCCFSYDVQYRYKVVNTPAIIGAEYTNSNTL